MFSARHVALVRCGANPAMATQQFLLQFDGGSRGNTPSSVAGAGAVLFKRDGRQRCRPETAVSEATVFLRGTNNEAEYTGLLAGLQMARQYDVRDLEVEGDSQLVVRQVLGEYEVRNPHLVLLYSEVMDIVDTFSSFAIYHIPGKMNGYADQLANEAMDQGRSEGWTLIRALATSTGE